MIIDALKLITLRIFAHKSMLFAVILGVMLSSTITSTSVVFFDSLRNLSLQNQLGNLDQSKVDLLIEVKAKKTDYQTFESILEIVDSTQKKFEGFITGSYIGIKTWTFFVDDQNITSKNVCDNNLNNDYSCLRANFILIPDSINSIEIIEGSIPKIYKNSYNENSAIEVLIDKSISEKLNLNVGDNYFLKPHWLDNEEKLNITISGIYNRNPNSDNIWYIFDTAFSNKSPNLIFANFLVPEETILNGISSLYPEIGTEYAWLLDIDPKKINANDSQLVQNQIEIMKLEMKTFVDGFILRTDLQTVLEEFDEDLYFSRLPMIIVISLIVLVVFYYTMVLSGLLVDSQKSEIMLLRIRGSTSILILSVFILEAIFFIFISVIVGPFLSLATVSLTGLIYSDLNNGMILPVSLNYTVFIMGLIGGLLSFIPMIIPSYIATKNAVISSRFNKSRPITQSFLNKYYLDVGLLILVIFIFWILSREGSFLAVDLFGEQNVSNLLLFFPAFFMVSIGIILLRVFPLFISFIVYILSLKFISDLVPSVLIIALWQMARNPSHYSKLSFLIVLTAGVGVFASTFSASLIRSFEDKVNYETGTDIRVKSIGNWGDKSYSLENIFSKNINPENIMTLYRKRGLTTETYGTQLVRILGIDTQKFSNIGWNRNDLNINNNAISNLKPEFFEKGILLPENSEYLGIKLRPGSIPLDTLISVRLSDKNDRYFSVFFDLQLERDRASNNLIKSYEEKTNTSNNEFIFLEKKLGNINFESPYRFHSFGVISPRRDLSTGYLDLDSIFASTKDRQIEVIDEFNDLNNWRLIQTAKNSVGDSLTSFSSGISRFRWTSGRVRDYRGITYNTTLKNIPVISNKNFIEIFGINSEIPVPLLINEIPVTVLVENQIDFFPSIESEDESFIIMDKDILHNILNREIPWGEKNPDEIWIKVDMKDNLKFDINEIKDNLNSANIKYGKIINNDEQLEEITFNPLLVSGWKALLGISFFTVLIVTSAGFIVHSRISFRKRESEHALLRTIGLSGRQLIFFVFIEQFIVIIIALLVGIFMGVQLGTTIMPYIANSTSETSVNLPMQIVIDWSIFLLIFGTLSFVFLFIMLNTLISVYKKSINLVMRMGND